MPKTSGDFFGDFSFGFKGNIRNKVPTSVPGKIRNSLKWLYQSLSMDVFGVCPLPLTPETGVRLPLGLCTSTAFQKILGEPFGEPGISFTFVCGR
jgi:hypothetical protein